MIRCLSCGAESSNGLTFCDRCRETFTVACVNVAAYFADVDRIRPGERVKVRSAYRSSPPPGVDAPRDPISDALDYVATIVYGWCQNLEDDRGASGLPATTELRCGWLEHHRDSIATLEWAGECLRELLDCERMLRRILDKADTGRYAGVCGNEIGRQEVDGEVSPVYCARHLYGTVGTAWVTCPECGRCWDGEERRERMRKDAANELAPVRTIARIVVELTDEPSVERLIRRIEKWVDRGQLPDYGVRVLDGRPRRVYRIGDVLRLVAGEVAPKDVAAC